MMDDLISRQAAIAHLKQRLYETQLNNDTEPPYYYEEIADNRIDVWMNEVPSVQPEHTNADRIRAMSDEELAHLLGVFPSCENCLAHSDACEMEYDNSADVPSCEQILLEWMKQETEEA